ncbi:MAG: hypothetical protein E7624_05890 [Ruminococcaceae bacterium]|nr:hypothetical protein [Oscillospiraceae bacterium]
MARKFRLRGRTRTILMAIAIILVTVTIVGGISVLSGANKNFFKPSEWELRTVNEDNLYQLANFKDTDGVIESGKEGISVKVVDDNVIKVSGTAETAKTIAIGTVVLEAGKSYVFDSSFEGTGKTMYMQLIKDSTAHNCYGEPVVFSVTETTTFTINLIIADEYEIGNVSLKPVICVGESADDLVSFYE